MNPAPNVYNAPPRLLAPTSVAISIGAAIALLALGHVVLGSAVLGLAVLALLFLMQDIAVRSSRVVTGGYDRARAFSGYAGASFSTWSRTSGHVARLRFASNRLLRERRKVQLNLGAAAYARDDTGMERLIAELRRIDEELNVCIRETDRAIRKARQRVARERLAVSSTEVRRAR